MWDLSFSCAIFIWNKTCLPSLQCWTEQDLCYHPETGSVPDPHYDAAVLPWICQGWRSWSCSNRFKAMISLIASWALTVEMWYDFAHSCTLSLLIEDLWVMWLAIVSLGWSVWFGQGLSEQSWLWNSVQHGQRDWGERGYWPTQRLGVGHKRGTWGKWNLKAHLIHQSVLAQIVWDGFCWWLLFPDRPCLSINELHYWFVVLATRLCLGPGWGMRGESSQLCCSAVTFTQGTDPDLFSVWEMF